MLFRSLNENARLIVFATTNPSSNGGVFELNQDLKSRFAIWNWDYPTSEQEIELVNPAYIPPDFVNGLLRLANETRLAEKKGTLDYGISTRDIADAFDIYRSYKGVTLINPAQFVLESKILGNYDDEDQINTVKSRIESIFGKSVLGSGE